MVFLFPAGMSLNKNLVSDIPAGTGKPLNFFYSVHAPKGLNAYLFLSFLLWSLSLMPPVFSMPPMMLTTSSSFTTMMVEMSVSFSCNRSVMLPLTTCFSLTAVKARLLVLQPEINQASSVADPGCLSRIPDPDFYPSWIPDPGS
jgi:hypothetical protein